ncbi:hypothetical protein NBRC116495_19470 [Aurantivibrio plasticivorans]
MGYPDEHKPEDVTVLGACDYYALTFKAGYADDFDGFVGLGLIVPLSQAYSWEGHGADAGLAVTASLYNDTTFIDLGYISRKTYAFASRGWELGVSYNSDLHENVGFYFNYHLMAMVGVRMYETRQGREYSVEIGIKY